MVGDVLSSRFATRVAAIGGLVTLMARGTNYSRLSFAAIFLFVVAMSACSVSPDADADPPGESFGLSRVNASAAIRPKNDEQFLKRHESFLRRAESGPVGLLFIGDEFTEGWSGVPEIWRQNFARYDPANFGSGGDQTQNLIWRLVHGELDRVKPKVVVVQIGTNNTRSHTGPQISEAHAKVVRLIRQKAPDTRILLLGIFPRDSAPGDQESKESLAYRAGVTRKANDLSARLEEGASVRFLDLGPLFLGANGQVRRDLMPDGIHLNKAGYQVWAEGMRPLLEEMMH